MNRRLITCPVCKTDQHVCANKIARHKTISLTCHCVTECTGSGLLLNAAGVPVTSKRPAGLFPNWHDKNMPEMIHETINDLAEWQAQFNEFVIRAEWDLVHEAYHNTYRDVIFRCGVKRALITCNL